MIDIFEYLDYRKLLKDLYEERKKKQPFFSYRYIGQRVGFKSAGFFSNIIQGKRNISDRTIFKFAELFKFNKRQTEFFELLVKFDQATQHERKKFYFERLLSFKHSKFYQLAVEQHEYFEKWYYVAIRELLNYFPFTGDYRQLARKLRPPISPAEAKHAIDVLLKLELIRMDDEGRFVVTNKVITTGPELRSVSVHSFQRSTMDLAKEAIDRFARDQRSISTITLSVSAETYRAIDEKLAGFRKEVMEMVRNDPHRINRIYQFNFQVFPLASLDSSEQQ
jgi:uncharacterized protein (TIGR02147 family)